MVSDWPIFIWILCFIDLVIKASIECDGFIETNVGYNRLVLKKNYICGVIGVCHKTDAQRPRRYKATTRDKQQHGRDSERGDKKYDVFTAYLIQYSVQSIFIETVVTKIILLVAVSLFRG